MSQREREKRGACARGWARACAESAVSWAGVRLTHSSVPVHGCLSALPGVTLPSRTQVVVTIPNVFFAALAYMAYSTTADGVQPNIVENLKPGAATTVVKLAMAANQLLTVPLFLIPMADAFERAFLAPVSPPRLKPHRWVACPHSWRSAGCLPPSLRSCDRDPLAGLLWQLAH